MPNLNTMVTTVQPIIQTALNGLEVVKDGDAFPLTFYPFEHKEVVRNAIKDKKHYGVLSMSVVSGVQRELGNPGENLYAQAGNFFLQLYQHKQDHRGIAFLAGLGNQVVEAINTDVTSYDSFQLRPRAFLDVSSDVPEGDDYASARVTVPYVSYSFDA